MKCIDKEASIEIFGSYKTDKSSNLMIVFEKCDPALRSTCKDETEIQEWLLFKYIVTLENERKFHQTSFGEETIG